MFDKFASYYIGLAIGYEYTNARRQHGKEYNSLHEFESVLYEEVEELSEELEKIRDLQKTLHEALRADLTLDSDEAREIIHDIYKMAYRATQEGSQVAGVCLKGLPGQKGIEHE